MRKVSTFQIYMVLMVFGLKKTAANLNNLQEVFKKDSPKFVRQIVNAYL